eukprot:PITA_33700
MGAKCSSSCFGSAMEAEFSKVGCKSESLLPSFNRRIKQKSEKHSSKPVAFSNYGVQISPTCLISGKSNALRSIVSISRDGELVPIILSPVGKAMSNERQPTKQKTQLRLDAAEIKAKSRDPKISVKSRKLEVCTEKQDSAALKKPDRSWIRVAKFFRFPKDLAFHRNGPKVSQGPIQRSHTNDTKTPVIEQTKAQDQILRKKEIADSIPGPIKHLSKSSGTSVAVDSKSSKLSKFVNFHRKVSSHATQRQGIKSTTLSQLLCGGMNRTTGNFGPKKINISVERKGTIALEATRESVGYSMAINLWILIIIMTCLVVYSNKLLAVLCTSIWWYFLPILLEKKQQTIRSSGRTRSQRQIRSHVKTHERENAMYKQI